MRPNYYVEGCPPQNSKPINGFFYRLLKSSYIGENDFIPYQIDPTKGNLIKDRYKACGLSLLKGPEKEVINYCNRHKGYRSKYIAKAELNSNHGNGMETPSVNNPYHYTRRHFATITPHTLFNIIQKGSAF